MISSYGNLATTYRELYRAKVKEDIFKGDAKPFFVPFYFTGLWALSTLYLAIPHVKRPWLYKARWLVLAASTLFNLKLMREARSTNFAASYGAGLIAAWGIIWNFTVLIWTKPQFDAKRVERRAFTQWKEHDDRNSVAASTGVRNGAPKLNGNGHLHKRALNSTTEKPGKDFPAELEYEYYWQPYPASASLLTRLDWAFDICSTMRMTGWNYASSFLPPQHPPEIINGKQQPLSSLSDRSFAGYTRYLTRKALCKHHVRNMTISYVILDFCSTFMTQDPYFILGPTSTPLPRYLSSISQIWLNLYRSTICMVGVVAALEMTWDFGQLLHCLLTARLLGLGFRADPWHYPTMFGSFYQVFDRGLAGFWGGWWHQTFRFGFAAPTKYFLREGYLKPHTRTASVVGALVAFAQSGFLHAAGSYTSLGYNSKPYMPPLFFLLSGVGVALQQATCRYFRTQIELLPRWVRRLGNFVFVLIWLHMTAWALLDDFGRAGLWMYEPVPISLFRAMGYGNLGDSWWRWDRDVWPKWYTGSHRWESGLAI